jgi:hypothetical protein
MFRSAARTVVVRTSRTGWIPSPPVVSLGDTPMKTLVNVAAQLLVPTDAK